MGVVHPGAEMVPTKHELLTTWLPTQPWWPPGAEVPQLEASFRLDDPAGEVGIETLLLRVGGGVVQVPMTYRSAPLEGGELIGETQHSALGPRWVYLGTSDPVYVTETTAVIREGRGEVQLLRPDGTPIPPRPTAARVQGSGTGSGRLTVVISENDAPTEASGTLTATWAEQPDPVVLAWLS
jgi:hypothetical protein